MKSLSLKRILAALLPIIVIPISGWSQGESPGVFIRTQPPGAEVVLEGDFKVSGISPVFFQQGLVGQYTLKVEKDGYESHESKVLADPGRLVTVDVNLRAKSRLKAVGRSMVIPGWGQVYADKKFKGYVFGALAVGALTFYAIAEADFQDKREIFDDVVARWDSTAVNGSIDDLRRLRPVLSRVQDDAYDAENTRRMAIGSVIGVWGIAFIDALFFFPDDRTTIDVKGFSLEPAIEPEQFGFTISKRF